MGLVCGWAALCPVPSDFFSRDLTAQERARAQGRETPRAQASARASSLPISQTAYPPQPKPQQRKQGLLKMELLLFSLLLVMMSEVLLLMALLSM